MDFGFWLKTGIELRNAAILYYTHYFYSQKEINLACFIFNKLQWKISNSKMNPMPLIKVLKNNSQEFNYTIVLSVVNPFKYNQLFWKITQY